MNKILSILAPVIILAALLKAPETQAQSWTNLGSGMNNYVTALAFDTNGSLYAGGFYTTAGGGSANRIAKWNGTSWTNLGSGMNARIDALAFDANGNLYAGGGFTTAGGVSANRIAKWNGSSWTNLGSGMNDRIMVLTLSTNGELYAGGSFTTAGGVSANNIAKWNGTSWTNLGSGMNYYVIGLAFDTNGALYAGGDFSIAGGVSANDIAKWNGSSWTNLGSGMNGWVNTSFVFDTNGALYAGGYFTTAGGVSANYIAKWNGTSWTNLGSGMNLTVGGLAFDTNGNLYVCGHFTTAGGLAANRTAKWNGSFWTNLSSGLNEAGNALVFDTNGALYVGGNFTTAGGVSANYIAKWRAVSKGSQTISFPAIATQNVTNSLTLSATASSGLPVSFSVGSGPAAINSNIATFSATGQVSIIASQAGNDNWNAAPGVTNTFTVVSVPSAPTGVTASDGTYTDRIRVSWNAVSGALGYQLFRNTSDSSNGLSVYATTTAVTYDDTAVSSGVNYYYWVKGTNAVGASAFSASDAGYLGSSVSTLDAPTGLAASDGTYSNLVRLAWDAVSGALYYELWRNTSNNSASASVLAQTTNSVTYDDTAVSVGVTYYYWVKARNAQTTSAFSHPDSGYASYVPATPAGNADLSLMTFLFLPATLTTNQHPGAVSVQLINYGPMNLTSPDTRVAIDFYLSANSTFGDEDDISIGDYTSDQSLGASAYTTIVVPASGRMGLTVPPTVTAGTYYVFARVRHTYPSSLVDPDESNNYVMREGSVTVTVESESGGTETGYHLINDYDGDGKSDLALYQETTGEWMILLSGSGYQTATAVLGGQGYRPALADYDGDGKSDLAVYYQASGQWQFMLSSEGYAISTLTMGGPGYVPVPADYDGDGLADPIVYHESSGLWQIKQSATNYEAISVSLGGNGYKAVAADFDGDGKSDIAVYRRSTGDWKIMLSSLEYTWTAEFQFGGSGFVPVPADYDADGLADPAVYKDSTGEWRVMLSKFSYLTAKATFGGNGFVAVPADYDGDGKGDVVVYSESLGELRILLSGDGYAQTVVTIGGPGYEPVGYYDW